MSEIPPSPHKAKVIRLCVGNSAMIGDVSHFLTNQHASCSSIHSPIQATPPDSVSALSSTSMTLSTKLQKRHCMATPLKSIANAQSYHSGLKGCRQSLRVTFSQGDE